MFNRKMSFVIFSLVFLTIYAKKDNLSQRSLTFDDIRIGEELKGFTVTTLHVISKIYCAKVCARLSVCVSFTFCRNLRCILNKGDIFWENATLEINANCDYHGMGRQTIPSCTERGLSKSIQFDGYPNMCEINQKRLDAEWNPWLDFIEIDTHQEWKFVRNGDFSYEQKPRIQIFLSG